MVTAYGLVEADFVRFLRFLRSSELEDEELLLLDELLVDGARFLRFSITLVGLVTSLTGSLTSFFLGGLGDRAHRLTVFLFSQRIATLRSWSGPLGSNDLRLFSSGPDGPPGP